MIRVLVFTTLYPNAAQPSHGVFVENRLDQLVRSGAVTARVVAPIPTFPLLDRAWPPFRATREVPARERRRGIEVLHPRYPLLPKVSMTAAPFSLYAATRPLLERIRAEGFDFDLIDAHYFYPDGVAAAMLGRALGRPVVITGRGTDLNLIPDYALPRRMIRWAARQAAGLVTVCAALKEKLVALGVPAEKVRVLRNGVDLERFRPVDRAAARARLGLSGPTLLSVGHLIPRKGHDLVIEGLARLPEEVSLLVAGDGPGEQRLRALAAAKGVAHRVRFLGRLAHEALREVYEAADVLVLASSREGWANVLLEAMACGTPVVASNVWGTPEVVAAPEAGILMRERTGQSVAEAVSALLAKPPPRAATRAYAEGFSWEATTRGQIELFEAVLAARKEATKGSVSCSAAA
jgi:glycosyltransferase involved in cell wall biosynthesis